MKHMDAQDGLTLFIMISSSSVGKSWLSSCLKRSELLQCQSQLMRCCNRSSFSKLGTLTVSHVHVAE